MFKAEPDPPEDTVTVCVCEPSVPEVKPGMSTEWVWSPLALMFRVDVVKLNSPASKPPT